MEHPALLTRFTLLFIASLTVMSGTTIAPALPAMAGHFAAYPNADFLTRLVLTAPSIAIAVLATAMGALLDRRGRRGLLAGAAVLYAGAGSVGLWADGLGAIVIGRVALGAAVAVLMTGATALIGDYFEGHARDRFMGVQAAFMGYGGVVFMTLGGALAEAHWRLPFAVYLVSLAVPVLIHVALPPPGRPATGPASAADGPAAPAVPAVPPIGLYGLALVIFLAFYQLPTQMPFLLRDLGLPAPWLTGVIIASVPLVSATSALTYGRLRRHLSAPAVMALALGWFAAGCLLIGLAPTPWTAWAAAAATGVGLGWTMPNVSVWLMNIVPARNRARAMGSQTAAVFIGQFLAPLAAQPLVAGLGPQAAFFAAAAVLAPPTAWMIVLARSARIRADAGKPL